MDYLGLLDILDILENLSVEKRKELYNYYEPIVRNFVGGNEWTDLNFIRQATYGAIANQQALANELEKKMVDLCPNIGDKITLKSLRRRGWRWSEEQTCEGKDCRDQAKLFANEIAQFTAGVALAEYAKYGKVAGALGIGSLGAWIGNYTRDMKIRNYPYEDAWKKGEGQSCSAWAINMAERYKDVVAKLDTKCLCFRGMQVSVGRDAPGSLSYHQWFRLFGPKAFENGKEPTMLSEDSVIVLDPWQSGGTSLFPIKKYTAESMVDTTAW